MGCCIGEKHSNWCQDNPTGPSYPPIYIDKDGNEYCIFHAPAECKFVELYDEREGGEKPALMSGEDFNQLVFDRIQGVIDLGEGENFIPTVQRKPQCNLAGTIFHEAIDFSPSKPIEQELPSISFEHCVFTNNAHFRGTKFGGFVLFDNSNFKSQAYFRNAHFQKSVSFREVNFKEDFKCFDSNFNDNLLFVDTIFDGKTSFNNINFIEDLWIERSTFKNYVETFNLNTTKDIYIVRSQFEKELTFKNSKFHDIRIQGVQFDGFFGFEESSCSSALHIDFSEFYGEVDFSQLTLTNTCYPNFYENEFHRKVYYSTPHHNNGQSTFSRCIFHDLLTHSCDDIHCLNFESCTFKGITDFSKSNFDSLSIKNSSFKNQVLFIETEYDDSLNIKSSNFDMVASFNNSIFHNEAQLNITDSIFNSWIYIRDATFNGTISFEGTICEKTILIEGGRTNLRNLKLIKTNIESFKFIGCSWGDNKYDKIYDELNGAQYSQLEDIYRRLKKISMSNHDQVQASAWHYREKRCLQKICNKNVLTKNTNWFKSCYLNLYFLFSGFGEKPLRAGLWLLIFIFASIFAANFGPCATYAVPQTTNAAIFVTPATADFIQSWMWYMPLMKVSGADPNGWNYLLKAIFNVTISIQAALFAFALRNKLRR